MATSSASGSRNQLSNEDVALVNELWEEIDRNPPAIEARKLLIDHLQAMGWIEAAIDAAQELIALDSASSQRSEYKDLIKSRKNSKPTPSSQAATTSASKARNGDTEIVPMRRRPKPKTYPIPQSEAERVKMENELIDGARKVRERAATLARDTYLVRNMLKKEGIAIEKDSVISDLKALADGKFSVMLTEQPTQSARSAARSIESNASKAIELATTDLETVLDRLRLETAQTGGKKTEDELRDRLAKRVKIIASCLSEELQPIPKLALMHIEHENSWRNYQNTETMYGDEVRDIPREDFWASEDGYAWSMDELSAAISANSGIFRNPLSKEMFSPADVKAILRHPKGKKLGAMQIEQSRLSKGVRPSTITKLDSVAKVLLSDNSDDQIASRQAVDDYMVYIASLPQLEQDAIDKLQVPARDSHTNQAFDCTIGDALRDGKANKICWHKVGDLLKQAAAHLRQKK